MDTSAVDVRAGDGRTVDVEAVKSESLASRVLRLREYMSIQLVDNLESSWVIVRKV